MAVFGLLAVTAVIEGINALLSLGQLYYPYQIDLGDGEVMSVWIIFMGLFAFLQLPLYILTVIFFLIWMHRSYKNLDPLGARHLEHTPGWAVGYWFIPIFNLFRPLQVVREMWNESDPDADPELGFLSSSAGTPALLGIWWALWLLSNITGNISARLDMTAKDESNAAFSTAIYGVASIVSMFAAIAAIQVVNGITARQQERFERIGRANFQSEPPPPPASFN
jgi:hypothetical protein